jgi:hypothetical protein
MKWQQQDGFKRQENPEGLRVATVEATQNHSIEVSKLHSFQSRGVLRWGWGRSERRSPPYPPLVEMFPNSN